MYYYLLNARSASELPNGTDKVDLIRNFRFGVKEFLQGDESKDDQKFIGFESREAHLIQGAMKVLLRRLV